MLGLLCTATHRTSRHTITTRTTRLDTLRTNPMLNQATRMGLIEGVVAITTTAQIAECQGLAPMLLFHHKEAEAVAQRPHNSQTCHGHQHLAHEAVDLLQKHPVQTHLQHRHLPSLPQSMLTTTPSARRKIYVWRTRGRKRTRRCRHLRSPLLVPQHSPNLASASH